MMDKMLAVIYNIIIMLILSLSIAELSTSNSGHFVTSNLSTVKISHTVNNKSVAVFNNEIKFKLSQIVCDWSNIYDYFTCTDEGVLLSYGICATQGENGDIFITHCPYFQLKGHTVSVSKPGHIKLPDNASELNDYMCGPMNRKGFLCKDCINGFGPAITSVSYQCSNCTNAWYGMSMFLIVEFVPVTLFYMIILIFKIHLTSAPTMLYIFYSHLIMLEILYFRDGSITNFLSENERDPLLGIILFVYGIWNFDFIRYITPPFCVSSKLQIIHLQLLSFISTVYPMFLIFLIWVFIKLRDHNFKLFVLLWRPFHKCFVMWDREWDWNNSIIDVFASFFLLTFCKLMYQIIPFYTCHHLSHISNTSFHHKSVMLFDVDLVCLKGMQLAYAIPFGCIFVIFLILPALLLVVYPFRLIRVKFGLNRFVVNTFVEKFHSCYRNGLDGDKDLRSFSGMYFFLIFATVLHNSIFGRSVSTYQYIALLFTPSALIVMFIRPYKHTYMTVIDGMLLAHVVILTLFSSSSSPRTEVFAIILIPAGIFTLFVLFKTFSKLKKKFVGCWNNYCSRRNQTVTANVENRYSNETKPLLIHPSSTTLDIESCISSTD